jgi:MFS family permease
LILERHDAYAVLRLRDFRLFISYRFFITVAIQMQSLIVGWQMYELTRDPLALGLIGLAEAIPFMAVALYSGHVADRYNRKQIIAWFSFLFLLGTIFLLVLSRAELLASLSMGLLPIYLVVALTGIVRAFLYPSAVALMAQLVPRHLYTNSSTWNSTVWHVAAISGPAIGGLVYGFFNVHVAYLTVILFVVIALTLLLFVKRTPAPQDQPDEKILQRLVSGLRFVFRNQVLLGTMSLDMFAVLFGGAVAMLPIFAGEILFVGPQGLGFLRAAPMAGAVIMSFILAYRPPAERAGKWLLVAVAGFGISIILFAVSRNFYLSLFLLLLSGLFDNISVIIRATALQLITPDEMRGRVAAVNSIFIGSSNELGSFESGVAARLMGLVPSVVFGGSMTLVIVGIIARKAPLLRRLNLRALK